MKTKEDEGPARKISRGRKRNSSSLSESALAKKTTSTRESQEILSNDIWFRNSFCAENKRSEFSVSQIKF